MDQNKEVTIVAGIILSLSAGFFDFILTTLQRDNAVSSFILMFAPMAEITLLVFLVFSLYWFTLNYLISPFLKAPFLPVALAGVAFLGVMFLLICIWLHFHPWAKFSAKLFSFGVYFTISFLVAALTYSFVIRSAHSNRIIAFCFALPFLFAQTCIAVLIYRSGNAPLISLQSAVLLAIYIAGCFALVWVMTRLKAEFRPILVSLLLMAVVLIQPVSTLVRHSEATSFGIRQGENKISPVILITIDTLRSDKLSTFGSKEIKTPNIDRLGSDGLVFLNAFSSAPWTIPSVTTIMTGYSPLVHHVYADTTLLPEGIPTLAERLSAAGYFTASIVCNPYVPQSGLLKGFHESHTFPNRATSSVPMLIRSIFETENYKEHSQTPEITERAVQWLQKNHNRNFFLWIHYLDPHLPYSPPRKYEPVSESNSVKTPFDDARMIRNGEFALSKDEKKGIRDLYDGEVRYVDDHIGKILDSLKRLGLYDSATIVLTSDHGEEFWEHNGFEHGHTLYNELLKVPLILKLPHSTRKGVVSEYVSTVSIAPTIINRFQTNNEDKLFVARSLLNDPLNAEPILAAGVLYFDPKIALIFDRYKYIKNLNTGHEELYDLSADSGEQISLTSVHPEKAATARRILDEQHKLSEDFRRKFRITNKSTTMDEETANQLRALGYLQ